ENVQMHHFSYMGDATVGAGTNIGAGTITMNYDGHVKHHTEIGEGVFLGCDTLLRAPVSLGDGASTGGGAVVTKDVPPGKLVVGMPARPMRRVTSAASTGNSGTVGTPGGSASPPLVEEGFGNNAENDNGGNIGASMPIDDADDADVAGDSGTSGNASAGSDAS